MQEMAIIPIELDDLGESLIHPSSILSVPVPSVTHPLGIAVGNGYVKAATKGSFHCVRSLIRPGADVGLADFSEYKISAQFEDSSLTHVAGKGFTLGRHQSRESHVITLSKGLKGEYYAVAALILAAYLLPDKAHTSIKCAVPGDKLGHQICQSLLGDHRILVNGIVKTIHVMQASHVAEAKGTAMALASARLSSGYSPISFAVIDFGHGNTTVTGIDAEFNTLCHSVYSPGVEQLILDIIGKLDDFGRPPTVDSIMTAIRSRKFTYGPNGRHEFKQVYEECLEAWWNSRRAQVETDESEALSQAEVTLIAGGGAALPGLAALAEEDGYACVENPQKLEVQGLLELI